MPASPQDRVPGADGSRPATVTEFTRRVKMLLEGGMPAGWVRGEVTNVRNQASGHVYFTLKDAGAQVPAVLFRGDAARQDVVLRDGMQAVVYGQVSVYEARGQYQIVVRAVVEDGVGRLQREFEALKRKLAEEGLFDTGRKVSLPAMPLTIGFITSPTGAAVQDFLKVLGRRGWRGRAVVLPAKVQGEGAAREIAEMIGFADGLRRGLDGSPEQGAAGAPFFDLLVVGRGGGSLEDLWAFNEEVLVRAVAACRIPVISAVGHEIDVTLCDFAADIRAETPTAAAELISSRYIEHQDRVMRAGEGLARVVTRAVGDARSGLEAAAGRLRLLSPSAKVEQGWLRVDDLTGRLRTALTSALAVKRHALDRSRLEFRRVDPQRRVEAESQRLLSLWKRLQAASPESVLNRGFAIVRDAEGTPVMRVAGTRRTPLLEVQFADGRVQVIPLRE